MGLTANAVFGLAALLLVEDAALAAGIEIDDDTECVDADALRLQMQVLPDAVLRVLDWRVSVVAVDDVRQIELSIRHQSDVLWEDTKPVSAIDCGSVPLMLVLSAQEALKVFPQWVFEGGSPTPTTARWIGVAVGPTLGPVTGRVQLDAGLGFSSRTLRPYAEMVAGYSGPRQVFGGPAVHQSWAAIGVGLRVAASERVLPAAFIRPGVAVHWGSGFVENQSGTKPRCTIGTQLGWLPTHGLELFAGGEIALVRARYDAVGALPEADAADPFEPIASLFAGVRWVGRGKVSATSGTEGS